MKFSEALEHMLAGKAMTREGHGRELERVFLVKGSIDADHREIATDCLPCSPETSAIPLDYFEQGDDDTTTRLPRFDAVDYNGNMLTGWSPSCVDLLAADWDFTENISIPFEKEFGAEEAA